MTTGKLHSSLYTKILILIAVQTVVVSFLCTAYEVKIPVRPTLNLIAKRILKIGFVKVAIEKFESVFGFRPFTQVSGSSKKDRQRTVALEAKRGLPVFTADQLALFDGSRSSKPVYLAILGTVFNVDRGKKHYAVGGGYHFFAGKDATRAFVTGDFTPEGLIDDVSGLSESEMLSIADWMAFYAREYELVGKLEGTYYDGQGTPTQRLKAVIETLERAKEWKEKQVKESEVFPPCNSEWQKESGGRVWCSNKSGGIKRDWGGVPRKLYSSGSSGPRCACVKNFGNPLADPSASGHRGDLDNPGLREYSDCAPTSNSCKLAETD